MGFTPRQIDELTFAEFRACLDGWIKANNPDSARRAEHTRAAEHLGDELDAAVARHRAGKDL